VKIVADIDLPFLDEMFAENAEVVRLKASGITSAAVRDADAVIVRSVTKVDGSLLDGSRVRFVGTATVGTDHVDAAWLASRGIGFANAPGCNANAVSEYVVAALLELSAAFRFPLRGRMIGVVGVGNVGSRVAAKASALGMEVLLNDPPLARRNGASKYLPLDTLMQCDILTLHVPLTTGGHDPTMHLFGDSRFCSMRDRTILINTARGAVVDTPFLVKAIRSGRVRAAVVDVWEGEPAVDPDLLSLAEIATAHIAGYSNDGKANASMMMYDAVCGHFGWEKKWTLGDRLPEPDPPVIEAGGVGSGSGALSTAGDPEEIIRRVVRTAYPIRRDDAALRLVAGLTPGQKPGHFLRLRNEYPLRREFHATAVKRGGSPAFPERELAGIGFRIE
jgi:erythronate-4-phosphate dehydrogenase